MSEITINLTEEQEKFLRIFALKQFRGSKDNIGTHHPLHLVQTQYERIVDPDYDDPDVTKYVCCDDDYNEYESAHDLIKGYWGNRFSGCPIEIVSFEEAYRADRFIDVNGEEQVIVDEDDYLEAYGIDEKAYHKCNTCYEYKTVAVFFILDEAKKYIKYQGYNLSNPRTYTISAGYANKGEYHHFWELLYNAGKKLNDRNVSRNIRGEEV